MGCATQNRAGAALPATDHIPARRVCPFRAATARREVSARRKAAFGNGATSQNGSPVNTRGKKGAETLIKAEEVPIPADVQATLERDLFPTMEISDDDYRALAAARAFRVRQHIAESGKVEQGRLFLADSSNRSVSTNGSREYLQLK